MGYETVSLYPQRMTDPELERIYDAHASGLFHYLVTFTKNEADARDLLQELFIKLARLAHFETHSEKAFLYRTGHNLAIDWLRRRNVRRDAEELLAKEMADQHQSSPDSDQSGLKLGLRNAMKSLPDNQRVIVQLKLWGGLTFEEIAEAQDIPMNTAASRYRYGLDKLRTLLRPIYDELR